jgi:purine-binding chemotaxis protein CheW
MDAELEPEELERIEDALRAELAAASAAAPPFRPARAAPALSDDLLDEFFWREDEQAPLWSASVALAPQSRQGVAAERREEWLTFFLGEEEYALPVAQVREILKPPPIAEVPRAPAHVLGVLMVRGEVVTVFDPRSRLGLPRVAPGRYARVLVCGDRGDPCGLLVDAVSQVVRLPVSAIEALPAGVGVASSGAISAIGREHGRLFILLDLAAMLGDGAMEEVP